MGNKIRKNDEVIVITGKYKGKTGKVKQVLKSKKIIVENINIVKKHQKPIPNISQPSGIIEKEAPIDISNVAIYNSITKKADKVKFKIKNKKKIRFFKSNNKIIK